MSHLIPPALILISLLSAAPQQAEPAPTQPEIRAALDRALVRVQAAASNYPSHRDCFSCHHQTLPVAAMVASREAGVPGDNALIEATVNFSADYLRTKLHALQTNAGIGGGSMTVGYGLWTFWEPDRPADDLSEAMVAFLLQNQKADGRWTANPTRPPLEDSEITATVLASIGLDRYATPGQRQEAGEAVATALRWLNSAKPVSQEDRNARLWGIWALDPDECHWFEPRLAVLDAQRPDGGWAQTDGRESDAYATGQTLAILLQTGLDRHHPARPRALRFLLDTQQPDGSWKVETRSRPIQTFFENGDPHGKSQFISTAATCWAAIALARALD